MLRGSAGTIGPFVRLRLWPWREAIRTAHSGGSGSSVSVISVSENREKIRQTPHEKAYEPRSGEAEDDEAAEDSDEAVCW